MARFLCALSSAMCYSTSPVACDVLLAGERGEQQQPGGVRAGVLPDHAGHRVCARGRAQNPHELRLPLPRRFPWPPVLPALQGDWGLLRFVLDAEKSSASRLYCLVPSCFRLHLRGAADGSTAGHFSTANLPLCAQVNATGVMPVIFASSLLAAPTALARYFNTPAVTSFAKAVSPAGGLYLPVQSLLSIERIGSQISCLPANITTPCGAALSPRPCNVPGAQICWDVTRSITC